MSYRKGQILTCPVCRRESVVNIRTEMDGWEKLGEIFVCNLCDAKLGDVTPATRGAVKPKVSTDKLADFLGTQQDEKEQLIDDDGERRFCKNCTHFLIHPFKSWCTLHCKDVKPMGDCPDFEKRED